VEQFKPILLWHVHVGDHRIEVRILVQHLPGEQAAFYDHHIAAAVFQYRCGHFRREVIVIHYQYAHFIASSPTFIIQ